MELVTEPTQRVSGISPIGHPKPGQDRIQIMTTSSCRHQGRCRSPDGQLPWVPMSVHRWLVGVIAMGLAIGVA